MRLTIAFLLLAIVLCGSRALVAHHSIAGEFDPSKTVTLKGQVTKIEWTNPHARIYIDVAQPNGTVVNWNVELAAVSALARNGWTRRRTESRRHGDRRRDPREIGRPHRERAIGRAS